MLEQYFPTDLLDRISFSLVHSTWIGLLLILIAAIVLRINHSKSSYWKSNVIIITMMTMLLTLISLLSFYTAATTDIMLNNDLVLLPLSVSETDTNSINTDNLLSWFDQNKSGILILWFAGVLLFSIKYLFSFMMLIYVRKLAILENDALFNNLVESVSTKLKYEGKRIKLAYSGIVSSPMVSGVFKPMIVFPIGLINQLSMEEVEGIVAHEISHLIRKDHVSNFLIAAMEIIFYYHPGVWWLNNQLKKYREEDCDDRVVKLLNGNITYIKTLVKLQELSLSKSNGLTLAINGSNESNFYKRIKRLMNMDIKSKNVKNHFVALGLVLIIGMCYTQSQLNASDVSKKGVLETVNDFDKETIDFFEINREDPTHFILDTIPTESKSTTKIIRKTDNQEVEMELENGEITKLIIDGKTIPKEEFEKHSELMKNLGSNNSNFLLKDNGTITRFEFPEMPEGFGDSFAFIFDNEHNRISGLGHRMDSLIHRFQNDSIMAFHFGNGAMEFKRFEDLDFEGFPEGFNGQDFENFKSFDFPQNFQFELRDFEHDGQDVEIDVEKLRDRTKNGFNWDKKDKKLEDIIGAQLNKDGFLIPNKENTVTLTGKYLKINGEKQPSNIWNKYKSLFEQETGVPLHKKSRLEFSIIGKQSNKRYKAF